MVHAHGKERMTHLNSVGSAQKTATRLRIAVTSYDAREGRFASYGATLDVHGRWTQPILDCFCDGPSQEAALSAPRQSDGSQIYIMSADAMRETRAMIISGASGTLSDESSLDGRIRAVLREAIGHCDHMVVGALAISKMT